MLRRDDVTEEQLSRLARLSGERTRSAASWRPRGGAIWATTTVSCGSSATGRCCGIR